MKKVILAIITKQDIAKPVWDSAVGQQYEDLRIITSVMKPKIFNEFELFNTVMNIARHREEMRKMLLTTDADAFFFQDADIVLPLNMISECVRVNEDIISGYYKDRHGGLGYTNAAMDWQKMEFTNMLAIAPGLNYTNTVPLGCCYMKRQVLEAIPFEHGCNIVIKNVATDAHVVGGEDTHFSKMAYEKGFKMLYHGSLICNHIGAENNVRSAKTSNSFSKRGATSRANSNNGHRARKILAPRVTKRPRRRPRKAQELHSNA